MHRATPANTSFRAFSGGGSRCSVDEIDDSNLMQECKGSFNVGESREKIESPQNYGFTSHNMPADESGSSETFVDYVGANRGLPRAGAIDDRRHRLVGLEKGDTAMYRTKDDDQQFHMTSSGGFWSAPQGKTVRMQLVPQGSAKRDPPQQTQQGQQGPQATQHAAGNGGGGTGQQQQQKPKPTGQKAVASAGEDSVNYVEVKSDETNVSGNRTQLKLSDKNAYVDCVSSKVYLGFPVEKGVFGKVMTTKGPAKNVFGRVG